MCAGAPIILTPYWFAKPAALAEIHRVLRPGGVLGLIWNVRDRSAAWATELSSLIAALEPAGREKVRAGVRKLIEATPELAGRAEVSIPYTTAAFCCMRL